MDLYEIIKHAIISGTYEPGKRLTEEWLASEFEVSRTPIREAIKQLEYDGLVTPLKRGVAVRTFSKEDIRQIYDLRALLESYAASQASIYRTDDNILKMTEANIAYGEVIRNESLSNMKMINEIIKVNQQFHETIVTASNNEFIRFHLSKVVVLPLVFRSFFWYNKQQIKTSLDIHKTILEAIKNRDADRAKSAMQEHVYQARDHVLNHLDEIKNKVEMSDDQ